MGPQLVPCTAAGEADNASAGLPHSMMAGNAQPARLKHISTTNRPPTYANGTVGRASSLMEL